MNWKQTWYLIRSDIVRKTLSDGKTLSFFDVLTSILSPPAIAVLFFRIQHYCYHKRCFLFAKLIAQLNIILFSVEIGSGCQADEGFLLGQANGILIHDQVIIGKNCTLMHQCSLGIKYRNDRPYKDQFTILGDDILVGSGVRMIGPCVIGNHSRIGMNAVVTKSFPEYSVIAGTPAVKIRTLDPKDVFTAETIGREYKKGKPLRFGDTLKLINQDLKHRAHIDGKTFTFFNYIKLFLNPPALAVFVYRWASFFDRASFKYIAKFLSTLNIIFFKTEIGSQAEIDGGFVLGHANGVIINNRVKIGKNAVFFHHNTVAIGPRSKLSPETDRVIIGDNFLAGAGARILGNIHLGDNCIVAMNAVVTKSAPSDSVLAGIPAKIVTKKRCEANEKTISTLPHVGKLSFSSVMSTLKQDIDRRAMMEKKKPNLFYYLKVVLNPPAMAVVLFRFASYFERSGFHLPAKLLANLNNMLYTVEIQASARIGPGLVLAHANGIMIHDLTCIGKNCTMTLHNTITVGPREGLDPKNDRVVIGDNVFIGMGSRLIGNITLGNNVTIGANAVVNRSAPDNAVLAGVPAKEQS